MNGPHGHLALAYVVQYYTTIIAEYERTIAQLKTDALVKDNLLKLQQDQIANLSRPKDVPKEEG